MVFFWLFFNLLAGQVADRLLGGGGLLLDDQLLGRHHVQGGQLHQGLEVEVVVVVILLILSLVFEIMAVNRARTTIHTHVF